MDQLLLTIILRWEYFITFSIVGGYELFFSENSIAAVVKIWPHRIGRFGSYSRAVLAQL